MPNYDRIAPYYDQLAKLVFGDAIFDAQKFLAEAIPPRSTVLIVGGGTGKILEIIAQAYTAGLRITYIESSAKMIALSKQKALGKNEVTFINQPVEEVHGLAFFDVIITPFFLDNFSDVKSASIFDQLNAALRPGGLWLFADFEVAAEYKIWQAPLLKIMYLFFKFLCHIEASRLPDTTALFKRYNYSQTATKKFFKKFIVSSLYRKP